MAITAKQVADAMWPYTRAAFIAQAREVIPTLPPDWNPSDDQIREAIQALAVPSADKETSDACD